ncbi:hypothetical protein [Mesorhizobium sp. B2-7-1]|uniref:hypothetical protein n=1 Tax=Mesorhizobium sp. B2-7-1 TaxID=2589909 RepID=UPI001129D087|nr:hypothetical protein [Mesorhizobium sp. B2-7-1]TPJ46843.1 hypothetical protein FJ471_31410 [Mesorhizobium sp. B2-7-1]
MALDSEKGAIDAAFDTLSAAVTAYIAAGGQPRLVGRWLVAHVANINPTISRDLDGYTGRGLQLRAATFANTPER